MELVEEFRQTKSFWRLPNDLLAAVIEGLKANDIYRLWKSGNAALQQRLRATVKQFFIEPYACQDLALWPSFILHLHRISALKILYKLYRTDIDVVRLPLESLSRLECLVQLSMSVPGYKWLLRHLEQTATDSPTTCSSPDRILLREILPNLKHCAIVCSSGLILETDHWNAFPPTLELLQLPNVSSRELPPLASLLPRLEVLQIGIHSTGVNWTLPPSLTALSLFQFGELLLPMVGRRNAELASQTTVVENSLNSRSLEDDNVTRVSLPNLRSMHHMVDISKSRESWDDFSLVPSLEDLILELLSGVATEDNRLTPETETILLEYFKSIPRELRSLSLGTSFAYITAEMVAALPPSLTELRFLFGNTFKPEDRLASFRALPRGLRFLSLPWGDFGPIDAATHSQLIEALPKSLTSTNILDKLPSCTDHPVSICMPALTSLASTRHLLSDLGSLPLTLTHLSLKANRGDMDPQIIMNLLRPLHCLTSLGKINPRPLSLVSGRDLLSNPIFKARKHSLYSQKAQPQPVARDALGELWYWTKDFSSDFSPSVICLDLALPGSLDHLELTLKDSEWKTQECQLQFDGSESSGCAMSSDMNSDGTEIYANRTAHSHFYRLNELVLEVDAGTTLRFGSRVWPSSLTSIVVNSPNTPHIFSLKEFLHVMPPLLQNLSCCVERIEREVFKSFPETMRALTLNSCAHPNKEERTIISILDLPKFLVFASFPFLLIALEEEPTSTSASLFPPTLVSLTFTGTRFNHVQSDWSTLVSLRALQLLRSSHMVKFSN